MADGQGRLVSSFAVDSHQRKILIFLACWLVEGAFCAIFLRGNIRLAVPTIERPPKPPTQTSPAAGTGTFFVRRLDTAAGDQPGFSLGWKNLYAENGRAGILKTPLHKTIRIDGLQVKLYQHVPASVEEVASTTSDVPRVADSDLNSRKNTTRAKFTEAFVALRNEFCQKSSGVTIESPALLALKNASKVVINGLDYRLLSDEQLELGIQCRLAVAGGPEVELRGGVIIQADGRKLISNYVVWDPEKEQFSVPGTYLLDRDGMPVRGAGIRCDHHLQPSITARVYSKKGDGKWIGGSSY